MEDKQALLSIICDIFNEQEAIGHGTADWLPAGRLAILVSEKLDIKPPLTAVRLMPMMEALLIPKERRKRGNRPTDGYAQSACQAAFDAMAMTLLPSEAVLDSEQPVAAPVDEPVPMTSVDTLQTYATALLDWIASLEPLWRQRIDALKDERGFDDLQALASLTGWTLDNESHMIVPHVTILEATPWVRSEKPCPVCGAMYREAYPGQGTCGEYRCGKVFNGKGEEFAEAV